MAHDLRPFINHATTFQAQLISPLSHGRGNFKGEGKYRAYYDDIVASKQLWMAFFDVRANYVHAEHTCGILVRLLSLNNCITNSLCSLAQVASFLLPHSRDSPSKGTLATLYRQRGSLNDCEAVLDVELEVLTRYQHSSEGACAAQVHVTGCC